MTVRRLSRISLAATLALVALGGYTRGSRSGYGCRDRWPLCENGLLGGLLPRADFHMIVEWTHRWVAALVGVLVIVTAVLAWRRARRWVAVIATGAVVALAVQAWIGREIVANALDADLVVLHLAVSMTIASLLAVTAIATGESSPPRVDRGWVVALGVAAVGAVALLLAGGYVHNLYVAGWPLVGGDVVPDLGNRYVAVHWLHRVAAAAMLLYLGWLSVGAYRKRRPGWQAIIAIAFAHLVNLGLGAAHVFTKVSSSLLVAAHLLVAALLLVGLVALTAWSAGAGNQVRPANVRSGSPATR